MSKYRVGIDCRLAGSQHAGIGRYVVELLKRVTAQSDIDWVLFFFDQTQVSEVFGEHIPPTVEVVLSPVQHYTLAEQIRMAKVFSDASLDLLHVPHFNLPLMYSRRVVITIHDLLWHEHTGSEVTTLPIWQYWLKYGFYRLVTRSAVKTAQKILVPTKTVEKTLVRYYPDTKHKIVVTPEGIGEELLTLASNKKSHSRKQHQLLYVGSLYPHKNVRLVIEALHTLTAYTLTVVGSRSVFRNSLEEFVKQQKLSARVKFVGKVSDKELALLYAESAAVLQPSLSEGFGLTGLEAIAFSTPVIASDIPVFREVYQTAAIYFNPHSKVSFCEAVQQLQQKAVTSSLAVAAPKVTKLYSWEKLADQTLATYLTVLNKAI